MVNIWVCPEWSLSQKGNYVTVFPCKDIFIFYWTSVVKFSRQMIFLVILCIDKSSIMPSVDFPFPVSGYFSLLSSNSSSLLPGIYRLLSLLLFPSLQASLTQFSMLPLREVAATGAVGGKRVGIAAVSQVILVLLDADSVSFQEGAFSALGLCWLK